MTFSVPSLSPLISCASKSLLDICSSASIGASRLLNSDCGATWSPPLSCTHPDRIGLPRGNCKERELVILHSPLQKTTSHVPYVKCDRVIDYILGNVLGQLLLLDAVLVQCRHKVRQRPGHPELDLQRSSGKDQWLLMRDRYEAEETRRLRGTPFATGTVGQRHHNRLQFLAADL